MGAVAQKKDDVINVEPLTMLTAISSLLEIAHPHLTEKWWTPILGCFVW